MSLRVWLPLNGSLDNQGLDNIETSALGTVAYNNSGKIGKAFISGGSSQTSNGVKIDNNLVDIFNNNHTASVAVWVKPLGTHVHYNGTILSSGNWNAKKWAFGVSQDNTKVDVLSEGYNIYVNCTVPVNEWTHLVSTYDNGICKVYKNGEYVGQITRSNNFDSDATYTCVGRETYANGYFGFNGLINDIRIYDHALSAQEVKKIAQGLIVHYPLNKNGWGQDNLLTNTHFDTRYSQMTGWDTTKNGTQLASSWGGYNGGVTNAGSVYHAHLKEVNDEYVYEFIKTANESWLGIFQGGLNTKLTAGDTYTFSWEEYHVDGINRVGTGLYYYKEGATSANFHLGIQQASNATREIGRWQKFSYTFVAPSDADYTKAISWYIYGHYNGNGTFYVRHPKLEKNSSPTTWCPNVSDDLYSSLNVNNNTMYDISGFGNNGTIHGTFSYITDTPLYKMSTSVVGSGSNYLEGIVLPAEVKTVSLWVKCTKSVSSAIFNDKTTGLQIGLLNSLIYTNSKSSTAGFTTSHWKNNDWNHVVVINNDGTRQCYVNGQSETQSGGSNYYIHNADNFWVWNRSYNNSYPYKGALSDLRIYTTALSADEVKELYEHRNNI